MQNQSDSPPTTATEEDRRALARCWECWSDGQDVDVAIATLKRLKSLGWLKRIGRRWEITLNGMGVLT